jgi:hypothetical protein
MGALFNTPGTLAIIQILSQAFQRTNFQSNRANVDFVNDLGDLDLSSYEFATMYDLVATGFGSSTVNAHWKKWLDYFDANGGVVATASVPVPIRTKMSDACKNIPIAYSGIEFFAIPAAVFQVSPTSDFADKKNPGQYTLIITVETPTYDQL